jgi:hypothetical protein
MTIKSYLFVVNSVLTLSIGIGSHSTYAESMSPFNEWGDLEMFQSKGQMRPIVPESDDKMREELKNDALAEKEVQQIDIVDGPEAYLTDELLNDEIVSVNLAERIHFNYEKAEAALATSHVSETLWDKFFDFIRWDKILSFMEKHQGSAEQWEQAYLK